MLVLVERQYNITAFQTNIPASWPGCRINGYILYLVFQSKHFILPSTLRGKGPGLRLTATALVTAIITLITSAAPHHDVAADITGRGITLHTLCSSAH